jgi:hypothetical protein
MEEAVLKALIEKKNKPIYNYIIPGLTSWNIAEGPNQTIRLYEASRDQYQTITPHSHRSKLECFVLEGFVENFIWTPSTDIKDDFWFKNELFYNGDPGNYTKIQASISERWKRSKRIYGVGESYVMEHDVIHSILFYKGAKLLLIKGPEVTEKTIILEQEAYGKCIPTLNVEPWMYKK